VMKSKTIILGTRASELARWQTNHVADRIKGLKPDVRIEIVTIKTTGDKILDSPLSKIGDKGLFTKEIEKALLDGSIDIAVHSLKDMPTVLPEGLTIGAITEREDIRDVFISHPKKKHRKLLDLPPSASIATGSLRRKCQLLNRRPDLTIVDIRGSLGTRKEKLEKSDWDGMILAKAGVTRLGWMELISEVISPDVLLPAVGQGALAVEIRAKDGELAEIVNLLNHTETRSATIAERALLRALEGGCQIPIGAYGRIEENVLKLDALVGSLDGSRVVRASIQGVPTENEHLGQQLAELLIAKGAGNILEEIRGAAKGSHAGQTSVIV